MIDALWSNLPYLLFGAFPHGPLGGAALTLSLAVSSALLSAAIGVAAGIGLAMTRGAAHIVLLAIVGFFRAIPVLMLIFWTFFLLPIVLQVEVPALGTVLVSLALIGGAYLAHAVEAGIAAVGSGQWNAGLALGLDRWQTLRVVVMPQAVRIMMPSFVNQWVSLVKDTSLAYIVGVPELSFLANQVNSRLMVYPAHVFAFVALIYIALCTLLDWIATRLTRAVRSPQRGPVLDKELDKSGMPSLR
ncbi:polar amino acid ABC transporter permease [Trinickia symbiotica]|uniref:Polar amino acid ABC transporter permease n=1 Tax=Trinickia symbiotica TaxID=863227 RepID=A0A2T3XWT3_9BURK|nr:amino acid ABC transporter permease [Trinickia symbiotica]PTB20968.1 polar amino acid ABC transporter permease [Trinickia symbiotica]